MHLSGVRDILGQEKDERKEGSDASPKQTCSKSRREMSCVSARSDPTKYILISVMARVMHCWNRNKYTSASL